LGFGVGPQTPNPQSPIPNPQSPIPNNVFKSIINYLIIKEKNNKENIFKN